MARAVILPRAAVALFACLACAGRAGAAPAPSPTPATPPPASQRPASVSGTASAPAAATPTPKPPKGDEWSDARRVFEQLPKDQQKRFLDNLSQWKSMSSEQQEMFRDLELFRREKIAQEIQSAINRSGLKLDEDEREVYALRYTQERRKIEAALRKEMDEKRQQMVNEMLGRLKVEFATQSEPPPKMPQGR